MRLIFCLGPVSTNCVFVAGEIISSHFPPLAREKCSFTGNQAAFFSWRSGTTSFDRFGICSLARFPWLSVDRSTLTLNRTDQSFPCARYDGYNTSDEVTVLIQRAVLSLLTRIFFFKINREEQTSFLFLVKIFIQLSYFDMEN